jgi:hypothetical protein
MEEKSIITLIPAYNHMELIMSIISFIEHNLENIFNFKLNQLMRKKLRYFVIYCIFHPCLIIVAAYLAESQSSDPYTLPIVHETYNIVNEKISVFAK